MLRKSNIYNKKTEIHHERRGILIDNQAGDDTRQLTCLEDESICHTDTQWWGDRVGKNGTSFDSIET